MYFFLKLSISIENLEVKEIASLNKLVTLREVEEFFFLIFGKGVFCSY